MPLGPREVPQERHAGVLFTVPNLQFGFLRAFTDEGLPDSVFILRNAVAALGVRPHRDETGIDVGPGQSRRELVDVYEVTHCESAGVMNRSGVDITVREPVGHIRRGTY